jgi:hypothetical protein
MDKFTWGVLGLVVLETLIKISLLAAVVYAAFHFIAKYW